VLTPAEALRCRSTRSGEVGSELLKVLLRLCTARAAMKVQLLVGPHLRS